MLSSKQIRKLYDKTLGTDLINSSVSPPSLQAFREKNIDKSKALRTFQDICRVDFFCIPRAFCFLRHVNIEDWSTVASSSAAVASIHILKKSIYSYSRITQIFCSSIKGPLDRFFSNYRHFRCVNNKILCGHFTDFLNQYLWIF